MALVTDAVLYCRMLIIRLNVGVIVEKESEKLNANSHEEYLGKFL